MWEQISNYLKNAEWDFWAVVLAVIAIIVSIVIYLLQRNKKELVLEIIANTKLLADTNSQIKVFFGKNPIKNPSILILQITNTSNAAIVATDFETDFIFTCPKAKILEINTYSKTESLNLNFESSETEIKIKPLLLNAKDSFAIKILLDNSIEDSDFKFSARIKDIKEIKRLRNFFTATDYFLIFLYFFAVLTFFRFLPDYIFYILYPFICIFLFFVVKTVEKYLKKITINH